MSGEIITTVAIQPAQLVSTDEREASLSAAAERMGSTTRPSARPIVDPRLGSTTEAAAREQSTQSG